MNKTLEISAMQYDFHILTNTNQKVALNFRNGTCYAYFEVKFGKYLS